MNTIDAVTALHRVTDTRPVDGTPFPVKNYKCTAGYLVRSAGRALLVGMVDDYGDGVVQTASILFRLARQYDRAMVVLPVGKHLYGYPVSIYDESGEPSPWVKLSLKSGIIL